MKKCCNNCRNNLSLEKWDYSDIKNNGVVKTKYDGFVCLAFASEGLAIHMVGGDKEVDTCEMYHERETKHERTY